MYLLIFERKKVYETTDLAELTRVKLDQNLMTSTSMMVMALTMQ